jgi:hypothetical protein
MHTSTFRVLLLVGMLPFAAQSTQHSSAQIAQEKGPPSYYTLLTPGMLAGPVFPYTFAAGKFRVEARNLIMGHAKASEVDQPRGRPDCSLGPLLVFRLQMNLSQADYL